MKDNKNKNWVSLPKIDCSVFIEQLITLENPLENEIKDAIKKRLFINDASFYRKLLCAKFVLIDGLTRSKCAKLLCISNSMVSIELLMFFRLLSSDIKDLRKSRSIKSDIKNSATINGESKIDDVFNFSTRVSNAIQTEGIRTVEDILKLTRYDLLMLTNLGKKSAKEVCDEVSRVLGVEIR